MCFFRAPKAPDPQPMPTPPPVMSRSNEALQAGDLPTKKELVDPDDIQGVEYGSKRKNPTAAAGKKTGTGALRIPLNTGGASGGGTPNV